MSEFTETSSYTTLKCCEVRNVWTINKYSLCFKQELEVLKSPVFLGQVPNATVWQMSLDSNFNGTNESVQLKLHIVENPARCEFFAKFRFGILNDNHEEIYTTKVFEEMFCCKFCQNEYGAAIPYPQNLKKGKRASKNSCKPYQDDKLIVFCEVSIKDPEDVSCDFKIPASNLLNNLGNLFGNPEFSDITLSAGGRDFQTHKVILAARSPIFNAMLTHNMLEKLNSRVEITDMKPEVLNEMLHFMYTGKTFNLVDTAADLLAAADRYCLDVLKAICGKTLYGSLSNENATDIFQLAQFFQVEELITETQNYILANFDQIVGSNSWITMSKDNPSAVNKIKSALIKKICSNDSKTKWKWQQNVSVLTGETTLGNKIYLDSSDSGSSSEDESDRGSSSEDESD